MPADNDTPFTPEACPGLSPEACALFNTPVEDCDPEILRLLLVVLARHIADSLPADLGMDAEALFSTLCGRLCAATGDTASDAPRATEPAPPPTGHAAANTAAARLPRTRGPDPAAIATTAGARRDTEPHGGALPSGSVVRAGAWVRDCCRWAVDRGRPCGQDLMRGMRRVLPPPWRVCYAACTGPPSPGRASALARGAVEATNGATAWRSRIS